MTMQIPSNIERTIGPGLARRMREDLGALEARPLSLGERLMVLATGRTGKSPTTRQKLGELTYRGSRLPSAYTNLLKQEYRPDDIGLDTIRQMEKDPVVHYGYSLIVAPILASVRDAHIECDDPDIKAFLEATFLPLLYPLMRDCLLALLDGTAVFEKVWEPRYVEVNRDDQDSEDGKTVTAYKGNALVYKKFRRVDVATLDQIHITHPDQDFDGFSQKATPIPIRVPAWKALVYANEAHRNGFYGRSLLNYVYAPFFFRQRLQVLSMLWHSKRASPPRIGFAPPGKSTDESGGEVDNLQFMADRLFRLEEFITIALPNVYDETSRQRLWDVLELPAPAGGSPYGEGIAALNAEILTGMFVVEDQPAMPNQSTMSYYRGKSKFESFVDALEQRREDCYSTLSRYCLQQLIEDNFLKNGRERHPEAKIRGKKISSELERVLLYLIGILANAAHPDMQMLNLVGMAEQAGLAVKPESARVPVEPVPPQALETMIDEFTKALEQEVERVA